MNVVCYLEATKQLPQLAVSPTKPPRFHEEEAAHIEEDRRICDVRPWRPPWSWLEDRRTGWGAHNMYPLVNIQKAIENGHL